MERAAKARAAAQADKRNPGTWGVSAEIVQLRTADDVDMTFTQRGRVLAAKRSDPFDLLHAARGLTDDQHRAARRLFRDWCLRAGVQDQERLALPEKIDGGRPDPSGRINQVMIDAGGRIHAAMGAVGPVNARLLTELISPMVDLGQIIAWRGVVQRVTGEADRNAQGAMVRQACESLRLVYAAADEKYRRERDAEDPQPGELRSFGSFSGGAVA